MSKLSTVKVWVSTDDEIYNVHFVNQDKTTDCASFSTVDDALCFIALKLREV